MRAQTAQPVNRLLRRMMHARGLDHYLQPSRHVTVELLKTADLILVMERYHLLLLGVGVPEIPDHVSIADQAGVAARVLAYSRV